MIHRVTTSHIAVSTVILHMSNAKDISNYPDCKVSNTVLIGDSVCFNFGSYNTEECGFDGEDCTEFNSRYPDCTATFASFIGDGNCDGGSYNTEECGYDAGDCLLQNLYPECTGIYDFLNNSVCEREYNTRECGFDGGDCLSFNKKYPNCVVDFPSKVGDGICNGGLFETEVCGFDGGDCRIRSNNYWWNVLIFVLVGTLVLVSFLLCVKRHCDIWANSHEEVVVVDVTTSQKHSDGASKLQKSASKKKTTPKTAEEIKQWRKENFQVGGSSSEHGKGIVADYRGKRTQQNSMLKGEEV